MATRMYVCESAEHPSSLLIGLNEQRLQGQLCDITVRVQGHLFKAHTNVLASAMGYFRDLFLNPNKQVKKDIIEIPMIVNSIGFAKVLDFIYTSQLCLSQSSVMQVLCSACYLQIPYVVDKCQEFIVTHGHVSSQTPGLPAAAEHRYMMYNQNKGSENSACELINTPPSPGNHSASNGAHGEEQHASSSPVTNEEPHDLSPGGSMAVKNEHMENNPYGHIDPSNQADSNPASRALIEFSNQTRMNLLNEANMQRNGALKILLQNSEGQGADGEPIDHDSLAEYFARSTVASSVENYPSFGLPAIEGPPPATAIEQHLYSMTKSISKATPAKDLSSSPTSSVSQYLLSMKKEKPKKEYRCEYCSKLFGRQQHLKRHILTHTGERPYPCHLCDKRFRRSEHLKHHLAKHQQETNHAATSEGGNAALVTNYSANRKRKSMPADAYSMSKMMLVSSCNQPKPDEQSPVIENKAVERDHIGSNPILLTKLNGGSALDSISERLAFAAAQRSEQEQECYRTTTESPIALNLSSKAPPATATKVFDQPPSPHVATCNGDKEIQHSPTGSGIEEKTPTAVNLPALESNELAAQPEPAENINGEVNGAANAEEKVPASEGRKEQSNPSSMSMENFATSEVMTSDLKRLFAAMDGC